MKKGLDRRTPEEWLDLAREDLYDSPERKFRDAAFSAERSLKAFLSFSGEENPSRFSHDLEKSIDECIDKDKIFSTIREKVIFLAGIQYGNMNNPSFCKTFYEKYNPEKVIPEEYGELACQYAGEIYDFVIMRIEGGI